jgi:hypothetical protein
VLSAEILRSPRQSFGGRKFVPVTALLHEAAMTARIAASATYARAFAAATARQGVTIPFPKIQR